MNKQLVIAGVLSILFAGAAIASPQDQLAAYMNLSKQNYAAAEPILKRLADEGDTQSQSTLATMYWTGMPGVPQNRAAALELYQRAASKLNGEAMAALGNIYLNGWSVPKDTTKAFSYLSQSVKNGIATGKIGLAICYLKGWGTDQDLQKSFIYTREAALQKVPGAAYNLADYYRKGVGTEKNAAEANSWYAKALPGLTAHAAQHPESYEYQIACGTLYQNGWGVAADTKRAAQYFARGLAPLKKEIAANKTNAMLTLSEMTAHGWGVKKDSAAAEELCKKAAAMGDKEAEWLLSHQ